MDTTLALIHPHAARKQANRAALVVENRRFSFHELDALPNSIAAGIVALLLSGVVRSGH
jgi:non-ribosomal peptide synthetase component E (peptide arylation enzyme)